MESRKMILMNYLQGSNGDTDIENRLKDKGSGEEGEWDEWREKHGSIYTAVCKVDSQWKFAVWLRELKLGLCNNLDGWERVQDRREIQEGGDICIPMTNSCWCRAESKPIL